MRVRQLQLAFSLLVAAAALAAPACASRPEVEPAKPAKTVIRVSGSGTCLPLLRILAAQYPGKDVTFEFMQGLHTSGGVKGVASGSLDIGAVSRELTPQEKAYGLTYTALSDDGLAVAVHPSVTVRGLTGAQVKDIYRGRYENWKQLGGPDLPIAILDRNEEESAKIIFRKHVLGEDTTVTPRAGDMSFESDMIRGVQDTPGAIGYFSLGYGVSEASTVRSRFLELDGVQPTVENIVGGRYLMTRPLAVVTEKSAPEAVRVFLAWATSEEAKQLMRAKGYAPHLGAGD